MNILAVDGKIEKDKLLKEILIPVVGGMVTGLVATTNAKEIYNRLKKSAYAPPSWVFSVVWTGLYATMGIAKYRISLKKKPTSTANALYDIQLGLIALLLSMITITTYQNYQKDHIAGRLMMPYVAWVAYAMGLNYGMWRLNG